MNSLRENISLWVNNAEPDYYLFFLKAWIPFNAWYVAEFPIHKKQDKLIIKELQDNENSKPRQIIENFLLNENDLDALKFRSHLAELNYYLNKITLNHNGFRLSFKQITLTENPIKFKNDIDDQFNVYKVERREFFFQAYIEAKGGKVLLDFKQPNYELEAIRKDTHFIRLTDKMQKRICVLFELIDPKKTISLITTSSIKGNFISAKSEHNCKFIKDKITVAKGCIRILYLLRNMLFHGEVSPTNANKPVYEHAYHLLRLIIKELH